jgi:hypothetical protein
MAVSNLYRYPCKMPGSISRIQNYNHFARTLEKKLASISVAVQSIFLIVTYPGIVILLTDPGARANFLKRWKRYEAGY